MPACFSGADGSPGPPCPGRQKPKEVFMSNKNSNIWIDRELLKSEAFRKLPAGAMNLYLHFLMKRQMKKEGHGRRESWRIKNNGNIVFTYRMAAKELKMPGTTFMRTIDRLIEHGFIDVAYSGSGQKNGDCSLYSISDRWEHFGTDNFKENPRPKDTREIGFKHNKNNIKKRVKVK